MDRTQTIVVALLIIAILFSAVSVFVSINATNFKIPQKQVTGQVVSGGNGGVGLAIENSFSQGGETNG